MGAAEEASTGCCQSDADDTEDEDDEGGMEVASLHSDGETMPNRRNRTSSLDGVDDVPTDSGGDGIVAVAAMLLQKPCFEAPIAFALTAVAVQDEAHRQELRN